MQGLLDPATNQFAFTVEVSVAQLRLRDNSVKSIFAGWAWQRNGYAFLGFWYQNTESLNYLNKPDNYDHPIVRSITTAIEKADDR